MSVGQVILAIAVALFFLAGVGVQAIPNIVLWGHFCVALDILTSGIPCWRPS